jgi:hypothetical protein
VPPVTIADEEATTPRRMILPAIFVQLACKTQDQMLVSLHQLILPVSLMTIVDMWVCPKTYFDYFILSNPGKSSTVSVLSLELREASLVIAGYIADNLCG